MFLELFLWFYFFPVHDFVLFYLILFYYLCYYYPMSVYILMLERKKSVDFSCRKMGKIFKELGHGKLISEYIV